MAVKEHQPLVNNCCTFCCKAVDFGTHDYCGTNWDCCPSSRTPSALSSVTVHDGATFASATNYQHITWPPNPFQNE
ncbi:hypothetical protein F5X99DRAFT_407412 [Biscogniauxia marginata]|nr:hypothetical protein F5X99DRAFT_407412 [Biscogniauxia marginata]